MVTLLVLIEIGFLAAIIGVVGVIAGFGGGIFLIPLLVYAYGFPMKVVIGTVLVSLILESLIGTIGAWRKKKLDFKLALLFGIPKGIGAIIGAKLTTELSEQMLEAIFGILALILSYHMTRYTFQREETRSLGKELMWELVALLPFEIAVVVTIINDKCSEKLFVLSIAVLVFLLSYNLLKYKLRVKGELRAEKENEFEGRNKGERTEKIGLWRKIAIIKPRLEVETKNYSYIISIPIMLLGGIVIGLMSGMLGVGGGWIQTPLLMGFGVPAAVASGTSLLMILISSITGGTMHMMEGNMDYELLGILSIGLPIGAIIGNYLKGKMKEQQIAIIVSLSLAMVSVIMIMPIMTRI
jgi:uncharacterized membrane protein YfcA